MPAWRSWASRSGLSTGLAFGLAQQARGAHFVSHDLWSAFLVWTLTLSVYAFAFRPVVGFLRVRCIE